MEETEVSTKKKRVICLYRVSTKGQVDKDDIPIQKNACQEFAERQGWTIEDELYEKGVSGFKVSAKDRDAIQKLQAEALKKRFDVLLVYMFDRIGRKDDETPFIVEWFVKNGIEVWSVVEGQQRFDSQVDKLINYIRYWQGNTESVKTGVRITETFAQMTAAGEYTGGSVPYGYKLERHGRQNKKKRELYELMVDEHEAEVVKLIFNKYVNEGFGAQRLSRFLFEKGYLNRAGTNFANTTINHMLKNEAYTGVLISGESKSQIKPELQIIAPELFQRAQHVMESRTKKHSDVPYNSKGKALLSGIVYCGHCKSKLVLTTNGYREHSDGRPKEYKMRYGCHNKVRHPQDCDGQSGYGVTKLDGIVDNLVMELLKNIITISKGGFVGMAQQQKIEAERAKLSSYKQLYSKNQKELKGLKDEIRKSVQGESSFDQATLGELHNDCKAESNALEHQISETESLIADMENTVSTFKMDYDRALTWAEMYEDCSLEAKKVIIRQLISKIYVSRDYSLRIEMNLSYQQFAKLLSGRGKDEG